MSTCPFAGLRWDDVAVVYDFYAHYPGQFANLYGRSQHLALDLVVKDAADGGIGWPLVACESGAIRRLPSRLGGPHQLAIETPEYVFVYTHMQSSAPAQWPDVIVEGDPIGTLGREGFGYIEPGHLHFMQYDRAACRFIDPSAYLAAACGGTQPLLSRFPLLDQLWDTTKEHPELAIAGGLLGVYLASRKDR